MMIMMIMIRLQTFYHVKWWTKKEKGWKSKVRIAEPFLEFKINKENIIPLTKLNYTALHYTIAETSLMFLTLFFANKQPNKPMIDLAFRIRWWRFAFAFKMIAWKGCENGLNDGYYSTIELDSDSIWDVKFNLTTMS